MDIVGVVDIRGGRAVHARGGRRSDYRAVECVAGTTIRAGDAAALAEAYVSRFGLTQVYVADLDAIAGDALQRPALSAIAAVTPSLWIDSGTTTTDAALEAIAAGASRVIVGLETLASFASLESICTAIGSSRVVFSLDLRHGAPMTHAFSPLAHLPVETIATRAEACGAGSVIVLDVGRVGMQRGCDVELLSRVRRAVSLPLYAGGGVRDLDELNRLAAAGCDGALVATALLNGTITRSVPALDWARAHSDW